jgi:hypothetical protein
MDGVDDSGAGPLFSLDDSPEGGDPGGEVRHRGEADQGDRAEMGGGGEA